MSDKKKAHNEAIVFGRRELLLSFKSVEVRKRFLALFNYEPLPLNNHHSKDYDGVGVFKHGVLIEFKDNDRQKLLKDFYDVVAKHINLNGLKTKSGGHYLVIKKFERS